MKLTLALALAVAALAGALLVTVLDGDGSGSGDQANAADQRAADPGQQEAAAPAAQDQESPPTGGGDQAGGGPRYIDPEDRPIGRRELRRVRDAAVSAIGGGTVTDIDRSDDFGVAYEVELLEGGRDVDVRLDRDLRLVATDYDD